MMNYSKYVVIFYVLQVISMTMLKFIMFKLYDHDACHLNKQVITKLKAVSCRPFSLCRPKGIKDTVFHVIYITFCLSRQGLATLADY